MPYVTVEVDLEDFDDDELLEELERRGLHTTEPDGLAQLKDIQQAMRMGKTQVAYNLMHDYIRDRLGTAI